MLQMNVIGNLGKDAELKTINNKEFITFTVASNGAKKDDEPVWVDVIMPNNPNSKMIQYLNKGTAVMVSGSPRFSSYQTKSGETRVQVNVYAHYMQMIGTRKNDENAPQKITETPQEKYPKEELPF